MELQDASGLSGNNYEVPVPATDNQSLHRIPLSQRDSMSSVSINEFVAGVDMPAERNMFNNAPSHQVSSYSQRLSSSSAPSTPPQSSPPSDSTKPTTSRVQKRTLNTLAARRYRQRRVDQISSLESALKEIQQERDEFKMRCARLEGEVEILRGLVKSGNVGAGDGK